MHRIHPGPGPGLGQRQAPSRRNPLFLHHAEDDELPSLAELKSIPEQLDIAKAELRILQERQQRIQARRGLVQLEDVEREQRAAEEQDLDTIELLQANRSEILAMYDEALG